MNLPDFELRQVLLVIGWIASALVLAAATLALTKSERPVWPIRMNMWLMRNSNREWARRYAESRTAFSGREQFFFSFYLYLFALLLFGIGAAAIWNFRAAEAARRERLVVWLPYAAGSEAFCAQGALGTFSHQGIFAWDFALDEGKPVVAVAEGRVIRVVDERTTTGVNNFNEANQIFVDHGGGIFATYLHHKAGTAKVHEGQLISAGTHLADVGKTGTVGPHLHFDVRGPSWHQTHDMRFRTAADKPAEVRQGWAYASATPSSAGHPPGFSDSRLEGKEFAANGVTLKKGHLAFRQRAEAPILFQGKVPEHASQVFFFLWRDAEPSEYTASAGVYTNHRFELEVRIPATSRGSRWYRITVQDTQGRLIDVATLPMLVVD